MEHPNMVQEICRITGVNPRKCMRWASSSRAPYFSIAPGYCSMAMPRPMGTPSGNRGRSGPSIVCSSSFPVSLSLPSFHEMMRLDESQQRVQRKCRIVEEGLFQGGFILPVVLYLFGIELMEPDPEFLGQRAGFGAVDGLQISGYGPL